MGQGCQAISSQAEPINSTEAMGVEARLSAALILNSASGEGASLLSPLSSQQGAWHREVLGRR